MKRIVFAAAIFLSSGLTAADPYICCEKKFGEAKWNGITFQRYALRAENFPADKQYRLIVKTYNGAEARTYTYKSNKKGHLIFQKPENVQSDILAVCPAKRGERLTFLMQGNDGTSYSAEIIPFPLEVKSKKGAELALELKGEKGELFQFTTKKLKPNEKVELILSYDNEKMVLDSQVSDNGELTTMVAFPHDKKGGDALLTLKRNREEVAFPFEWGEAALDLYGACCFQIR